MFKEGPKYDYWVAALLGFAAALLIMFLDLISVSHNTTGLKKDIARYKAHEIEMAHKCTFRPDGSGECPPGTFYIDHVKK